MIILPDKDKTEQLMNDLNDQIVQLWIITFDQDVSRTYIHNSREKVLASVEGTIHNIAPDGIADALAANVIDQLATQMSFSSFIPMMIQDTVITVRRIDLDKHNPLVICLNECYDYILADDRHMSSRTELMNRVRNLFTDPANVF